MQGFFYKKSRIFSKYIIVPTPPGVSYIKSGLFLYMKKAFSPDVSGGKASSVCRKAPGLIRALMFNPALTTSASERMKTQRFSYFADFAARAPCSASLCVHERHHKQRPHMSLAIVFFAGSFLFIYFFLLLHWQRKAEHSTAVEGIFHSHRAAMGLYYR